MPGWFYFLFYSVSDLAFGGQFSCSFVLHACLDVTWSQGDETVWLLVFDFCRRGTTDDACSAEASKRSSA